MSDFEKFKEELPSKKSFVVFWPTEKVVRKNRNMFLMFGKILKWKRWKIILACT